MKIKKVKFKEEEFEMIYLNAEEAIEKHMNLLRAKYKNVIFIVNGEIDIKQVLVEIIREKREKI